MKACAIALLTSGTVFLFSRVDAQVSEQHPYRQITLRTRVKLESSREKEAKYRYSPWGNLYSSDRLYTQKVRLFVSVTNASGTDLKDMRVQYRIYKRSLDKDEYSAASSGEVAIPQINSKETKTVSTEQATCQYRLMRNKLLRGNRLSRSGEKYAGYVVIYSDSKGPICWDMSSQTMYAEYARELRASQNTPGAISISASGKPASLPYPAETGVYITRTGRKFHRKTCRFVQSGARVISREDALKSGFAPCSVCRP